MKKIFIIAAIAALFTGCSQNEAPDNVITKGTPLAFTSASIAAVKTKAGSSPITTDGVQIGVFMSGLVADGYTSVNDVAYKYTAGTTSWGVSTAGTDIFLNNKDASVCAYYPLGAAGITSATDATAVPLTSQVYTAAQDLAYKTNQTVNNVTRSISLNDMVRAYSQITFSIQKDATYTGVGLISQVQLSNAASLASTNTLNITAGTYGTPVLGAVTYAPNPAINSMATYNGSNASTSSVLLVPVTTTMTTPTTLSLTIDGTALTTSISAALLPTLAAGTNYGITVVVKGTALTITSVSTTDWITSNIATPVYPQ